MAPLIDARIMMRGRRWLLATRAADVVAGASGAPARCGHEAQQRHAQEEEQQAGA